MANTFYITAGLPVAKDADQDPDAGVNTVYMSAGLVPEELPDSGGGFGGVSNVLGGWIAA